MDDPNREPPYQMVGESLTMALNRIADAMERRLELEFPQKKKAPDATYSKIKTEEENLREEQGGNAEEPLEEWVGLREKEFEERKQESGTSASAKPKDGADAAARRRRTGARRGSEDH